MGYPYGEPASPGFLVKRVLENNPKKKKVVVQTIAQQGASIADNYWQLLYRLHFRRSSTNVIYLYFGHNEKNPPKKRVQANHDQSLTSSAVVLVKTACEYSFVCARILYKMAAKSQALTQLHDPIFYLNKIASLAKAFNTPLLVSTVVANFHGHEPDYRKSSDFPLVQQAYRLWKAHQLAFAQKAIESALEKNPHSNNTPFYHFLLAKILDQQGENTLADLHYFSARQSDVDRRARPDFNFAI